MKESKKSFELCNTGKVELSVLNMYLDVINNYDHENKMYEFISDPKVSLTILEPRRVQILTY